MKLEKLGKTLLRELGRNKKKTAALALLCAVAGWFWLPLLWKWAAPSAKVAESSPEVAFVIPAAANSPARQIRKAGRQTWRKFRERLAQDRRMSPAGPEEVPRDPFSWPAGASESEGVAVESPTNIRQAPLTDMMMEDVSLAVSAIVTGPRGGMARIAGRTYRVGDVVKIDPESGAIVDGSTLYVFDETRTTGNDSAASSPIAPQADASESADAAPAVPLFVLTIKEIRPNRVEMMTSDGRVWTFPLAAARLEQDDTIVRRPEN